MSDIDATLNIPFDLRTANVNSVNAMVTAEAYANSPGCDAQVLRALNDLVVAHRALESRMVQIVRARNAARAEREAAYRAQPYRFVINNEDGTQTKGGAESKDLAIDHLRKVARENPGVTCFYTGKRAALARPMQIKG